MRSSELWDLFLNAQRSQYVQSAMYPALYAFGDFRRPSPVVMSSEVSRCYGITTAGLNSSFKTWGRRQSFLRWFSLIKLILTDNIVCVAETHILILTDQRCYTLQDRISSRKYSVFT